MEKNQITRLITLADNHKVNYYLMIFAHANKELFNEEQIKYLNDYNKKIAAQSLKQSYELKRITGYLNSLHIRYLCIKGPQLSRMLYGLDALKESVDLDLMLGNRNDLKHVHSLLTEAGYAWSNLNNYQGFMRKKLFLIAKREISYYNPRLEIAIDLHIRPGANTYITQENFRDFFEDIRSFTLDETSVPVLPDEAYFVYLCYHAALHQFSRLAWLVDIRTFLEIKESELNSEKVTLIARKWKVERCISLTLLLMKSYFGDEFFINNKILTENSPRMRFLKNSCHHVLLNGFGYGLSLRGRISKIIYVMVLLKGFFAKSDWLFGVFMRKFITIIAKKKKSIHRQIMEM